MVLYDSVKYFATINSNVSCDVITISGYVSPEKENITIKEFGNVVNYYYYKDEFTVSYQSNGGSNVESKVYAFGSNIVNELPTPTRSGYTFGGWYSDSKLSSEFDGIVRTNTTLYAWWKEETKTSEFTFAEYSSYVTINSFVGSSTSSFTGIRISISVSEKYPIYFLLFLLCAF